ncbi:DNA-binding transcriptional LysR family regulator [Actinoplanes campanulatus]|uniref:DNA-binding transcriptional LysR family regulator n=1 Tax=Actinoplanes campanulatus TaxID=113559 RepID=A0A7W5AKU5_9ACTN|nr:LysR family transcriptional regulator [Actinoplanes campanulatus]MBB3098133.1 DNA-binding transcriptional LysR family regulator [Actinoplanes campanulatus]GGN32571.1 LysR family transcriptional regulator [Actinoplanes campanulatus]GID39995.1 LysR family transcriptional regulator [Actinoplanes campanulatus]
MANPRVSSDALAAFAVFADHLNMTRAARELHISQPSLHSKLATLARELGRPLYLRAGNRLQLTADGERVARFARDHQERLELFLADLRGVPVTRPLVIASGHTAYLYLLGDVIRGMLSDRPGSLRPLHTNRQEMQAAVRTGQAHLGVFSLHVLPADLVTVPIAGYPQMLLMPAEHPLASRRSLRLRDLAGAELIVPPPVRPHRINLERALTDAGVGWTIAVEAEGLPMTLDFASLGVGLAVVAGCVEPPPGLVARPITDLPRVTFHAIHRPGALDDPRVAELFTRVREAVPAPARRRAAR